MRDRNVGYRRPPERRPRRAKLLLRIQFLVVAALAVAGAATLVYARLIPVVPNPSTMTAELIFAVGAVPLVLLAWRAGRTYLLTRRISDLVVVEGIVWLTTAQFGLLNFTMMSGGWWAAHALEVAGIGMVAIGERLGLPQGRLRQLAVGGLLHDVGKLSVPNEILNKPGRLTDEEFDEIRRHPGAGRELVTELGGFSPLVLDLVESHYERLDAGGYPNRVPAGDLDLEVPTLTPTSTTRSPPTAYIARHGRPSGRSRCSTTKPAARSAKRPRSAASR